MWMLQGRRKRRKILKEFLDLNNKLAVKWTIWVTFYIKAPFSNGLLRVMKWAFDVVSMLQTGIVCVIDDYKHINRKYYRWLCAVVIRNLLAMMLPTLMSLSQSHDIWLIFKAPAPEITWIWENFSFRFLVF